MATDADLIFTREGSSLPYRSSIGRAERDASPFQYCLSTEQRISLNNHGQAMQAAQTLCMV